ncbi:MAG: hypothetical protein CL869_02185 [Cytophagia bacterium]|nr:hypothetical protein [Cytophagia bacterium]|tara:strand:- start:252 stop:1484 length:1233 start_codon:yes stop_codon:yes gene_type:complete
MKLSLFIAWRYVFSKKKKTFINFLSYFSIASISIGTAAMIIVLSVFNGLENTLMSIYKDFDPNIKIEHKENKYFNNTIKEKILSINGVKYVAGILENKVLFQNEENEAVGYLKGVDNDYLKKSKIKANLVEGNFEINKDNLERAVFGRGLKYSLGIKTNSNFQNINVYALSDSKKLNPNITRQKIYKKEQLKPTGIFAIEKSFDNNYAFTTLDFTQRLFEKETKISSYEVEVKKGFNPENVRLEIKNIIGSEFRVLGFSEQRESLFKILRTEKLIVYIVFSIILLLSSLNIFFLLSMMGIEKRKDIKTLLSFGISISQIKKIFILQGVLIGFSGIVFGTFLGVGTSLIQEYFGIVKINMTSSILESYPIELNFVDIIFTITIVFLISIIASLIPSNLIKSGDLMVANKIN